MSATTVPAISASAQRRLRMLVETYYDQQEVRIETEHRIRSYSEFEGLLAVIGDEAAMVARRAGPTAYRKAVTEVEENPVFLEHVEKAINLLRSDERHKKIDQLANEQERILKTLIRRDIGDHPLWTEWLSKVRGIGECLAGGLLAWINIERCVHVSQLWKYMGLSVDITSWICPSCRNEIGNELKARGGVKCAKCGSDMLPRGEADRRRKGEKTTYNPKCKVLCFKIGDSFVKQNPEKSKYRKLYERTRAKVDASVCSKIHKDEKGKVIPCFDAHKFRKAKRETVKIFIAHVYLKWRTLAGLPVSDPFIFWKGHDLAGFIEPMMDE